jgi:biotin carboxyl carrier protein
VPEAADHAVGDEARVLKLSPQARKNLNLLSSPARLQSYWRTLQIPGTIVDRPGQSDHGVTAPAVATVLKVHSFPGDTVRPGDRLFTLRLISEYVQNAQSELFKTTRDIQLVTEQKERLKEVARTGAIAESKVIELDNQMRRLTAAAQAQRQDLLTRGLSPADLERVAQGKFVTEIEVVAPQAAAADRQSAGLSTAPVFGFATDYVYSVHDLKVELGQQVQAGQTLCLLANHQVLYIEGHGFRRDAASLEQTVERGWPVRVEFGEDDSRHWPPLNGAFAIRHLAFYLPLVNQSRSYEKDGRTFVVWRFRPGQRVRLHVPVEEFKDVFVLPAGAVVLEGAEAYVFRQNGDLFDRWPVHVLYEDRANVVVANDGSISPGTYLAQGAAAALNRILKAQNSGSGLPPGAHFHADGSLHVPGQ